MDSVQTILKALKGRVIGLDSHPDTFTAAVITGRTPADAIVEKICNKLPMSQLVPWAIKNTSTEDCFALEASGNSFDIVRRLHAVGRLAVVLESFHLSKLKEAHANNDKLSAVRIGKAFLAATAKRVWVPDPKTQERRDIWMMYGKAVKHRTQAINSLTSYLSDYGIRMDESLGTISPEHLLSKVLSARQWSLSQQSLLKSHCARIEYNTQQIAQWRELMATEVSTDPLLLSLTRLAGLRDIIAYALGAVVGEISRFPGPKQLVKYFGLCPVFDDSGNETWSGGIGGHGRKDIRALLIEAAQAIVRGSPKNPLGIWGRKLMARKGSGNLAVAAVARRLAVAIWYLMSGRWEEFTEVSKPMSQKIGKIISRIGAEGLDRLGKTRKQMRQEMTQSLKAGRIYTLKRTRLIELKEPKPKPVGHQCPRENALTLAQEYGLA